MMAGAVTVTSITPVTGYQTITVNAATDSQEKEAAQGYQTNLTGLRKVIGKKQKMVCTAMQLIKETVLHSVKQQLRILYILQT